MPTPTPPIIALTLQERLLLKSRKAFAKALPQKACQWRRGTGEDDMGGEVAGYAEIDTYRARVVPVKRGSFGDNEAGGGDKIVIDWEVYIAPDKDNPNPNFSDYDYDPNQIPIRPLDVLRIDGLDYRVRETTKGVPDALCLICKVTQGA